MVGANWIVVHSLQVQRCRLGHLRRKHGRGEEKKYMTFGEKTSIVALVKMYETGGSKGIRIL